MKILMVATEAAPLIRTGDVANVVTELARQLRRQDHDVRVAIPFFHGLQITDQEPTIVTGEFRVPIGGYERLARLRRWNAVFDQMNALPVYLVECSFYFGRENPYGYHDDYERFIFFTRAVLEGLRQPYFREQEWLPEVIHGHDWSAGLIPFWLRTEYQNDAALGKVAFVYTLHNAGFPGQFGPRALTVSKLDDLGIYENLGESPGVISLMARGIFAADVVNTVSPTHAREINDGHYAGKLQAAVRSRPDGISGILNGLDSEIYDPAFDSHLEEKFGRNNLFQRKRNKAALQSECELPLNEKKPLIGIVCRLIAEKGIGFLGSTLRHFLAKDRVQAVVQGTPGDFHFQEELLQLMSDYPKRIHVSLGYDERRARRIVGGSDILVVPSLREPCGLQQLIAMTYGALPVVHRTGGLADTVVPWNDAARDGAAGSGFVFTRPSPEALSEALEEALRIYHDNPALWGQMQRHNMGVDFSWQRSAREYEALYRQAVERCRSRPPLPAGRPLVPQEGDMLVSALLEANDLATVATPTDYLEQMARNIHQLLKSDGVLIWITDEVRPQQLVLGGKSYSLDRAVVDPAVRDQVANATIEAQHAHRIWSWQYVFRLQPGDGGLESQVGYLSSELAQQEQWKVQLRVPLSTHGAIFGHIDVFSADPSRDFQEQHIQAACALAHTIAVNLERGRRAQRRDLLQNGTLELAMAGSVAEVASITCRWAAVLTGADNAYVVLQNRRYYASNAKGHFKELNADEFNALPKALLLSKLQRRLEVERHGELGVLMVGSAHTAGFIRESEWALQRLAQQAACFPGIR